MIPGEYGASGGCVPVGMIARSVMFSSLVGRYFRLSEGLPEVCRAGDPAEECFHVEDGRLLKKLRAGLVGGVFEHHAEIFEMEAIAKRRLDANVGGDPAEYQISDAARAQHAVELT